MTLNQIINSQEVQILQKEIINKMETPRLLKRNTTTSTPEKGYVGGSIEQTTAACVSELMNAGTSFHKLHLKVTGVGSFAAHKALNSHLYDR